MFLIGHGRYKTTAYPVRSATIVGVGQRFTPEFQSASGDASLGTDGLGSATYAVIGRMLYVSGVFEFGTGATEGNGGLLLPFPPGYAADSIDNSAMPRIGGSPTITESVVQVVASGTLAGTAGCFQSDYFLETDGSTVLESAWEIDLSALQAGDSVFFSYMLPLK